MTSPNNTANPVTQTTAPPDNAQNYSAKRKKALLKISLIFAISGVTWFLYWLLVLRNIEETDDAYVQGNIVQITPQIAGIIIKIHADDTDVVEAGQTLISLDSADADLAVAKAEAQLAQAVREARTLYALEAQASAHLTLRLAELARAKGNLSRRKSLTGSGAVSDEEIQHAEEVVATANAATSVAKEQLTAARALTEGTDVAKHPNVKRAAADLQDAMLMQSRITLYAPVTGQIVKRVAQVGQRISPGTPTMAIVPLNALWVDANFRETQVRKMNVGQPVTLTTDLYGSSVKFRGKVTGISAGSGSAFAMLPPQNATGNWIKIVQRIPVRIAINPKDLAMHPLRIGVSATVKVGLDEHDDTATDGKLRLSTMLTSYSTSLTPIDSMVKERVEKIVSTNLK